MPLPRFPSFSDISHRKRVGALAKPKRCREAAQAFAPAAKSQVARAARQSASSCGAEATMMRAHFTFAPAAAATASEMQAALIRAALGAPNAAQARAARAL